MGFVILIGPFLKMGSEFVVGDDEDLIDAFDGSEVVEDVIDHGFAGHCEEGLGLGDGQWIEACCVACG